MTDNDTIFAAATPAGESAIAVIRASGPEARVIAAGFNGGRPPLPRHVWHGDYRTVGGAILDDALFTFFARPESYTGEDVLEISCHGNPFIVSKISDDLRQRGCRRADPGEFTRRAFLGGRMDLTRAEAVMDVIRARSERALEAAQRQLRGAVGRHIEGLVERVLNACAAVEACIDFPEEDLPPQDRKARQNDAAGLAGELRQLAATRRRFDLLREGARVVLAGEPNAGKSSLLNRLAGFERAIVSPEPGTTRDYLEEPLLLGPHRIRAIDTAGLRESPAAVERAGVERALERAAEADIVVLVADGTRPCPTLPAALEARLVPGDAILVVNKIDLPDRRFRRPAAWSLPEVEVSATTGAGMPGLEAALISLLDAKAGRGSGEPVAVNARHAEALEDAAECLARAAALLERGEPLELVGSELRGAVDALGRIVGRIDNEAMLDRLFAAFCIGK
jgi:tRNA modification GTPase